MTETQKPQQGTWTLTAPDGRTWQAGSPLQCCSLESRERVPAEVALQRIKDACAPTPDEADAERYHCWRAAFTGEATPAEIDALSSALSYAFTPAEVDAVIDAAMAAQKEKL